MNEKEGDKNGDIIETKENDKTETEKTKEEIAEIVAKEERHGPGVISVIHGDRRGAYRLKVTNIDADVSDTLGPAEELTIYAQIGEKLLVEVLPK